MPRTSGEITAIYCDTMQFRPNSDGTAWLVGRVEADGVEIKVTGVTDDVGLEVGLTYRFWGAFETNKWGEQFKFTAVVEEQPATQQGIVAYLQQCPGVGPVTARKMWELWKDDAVRMLREQPEEVLQKVPRLTVDHVTKSSALLKERAGRERIKIDLMGLLHRCGVPAMVADQAIREWGVEAADRIRQNPYLLMRFRGIGFLKTDKLWIQFGLPAAKLKRQALCCWYSVASKTDGCTWYPIFEARNALSRNISGAFVEFDQAMRLATKGQLLSVRESGPQQWIAERQKDTAEGRVARFIDEARVESLDAIQKGGLAWPDVDSDKFNISDHQREQLRRALGGVVSILAGSPGTGKTYCAAQVIKVLIEQLGAGQIAAAAPTGKAAVRLTETLANAGVMLSARTIHKLLCVESSKDGGFSFLYNENRPLPYKVVLFDEASMIDTPLMASILAARGMGTHYLFLGDPNQLAPVGHGAPLRDLLMCSESVPHGELREIQRNSGRIVRVCADIRDKKRWSPSPKLDLDAGENLLLIERDTPEAQIEALESLLQRMKDAEPRKFDPIWDVQVLVAVNKKGPLSRKALNERLQALLNPDGQRADRSPFRVGDKIVNSKNGYLPPAKLPDELDSDSPRTSGTPGTVSDDEIDVDDQGRVYVANGEQAEVIEVTTTRTIARLTSPDRIVAIGRKAKSADEEDGQYAPTEGESAENAEGKTDTGCAWELGYAGSVHKAQGSEWPVVIVMLDSSGPARMTCSRQWLFTGISRGKVLGLLIGTKKTADEMCGRDALFKRKTFLRERIEELRKLGQPADAESVELAEIYDQSGFDAEAADVDDLDAILEGVI